MPESSIDAPQPDLASDDLLFDKSELPLDNEIMEDPGTVQNVSQPLALAIRYASREAGITVGHHRLVRQDQDGLVVGSVEDALIGGVAKLLVRQITVQISDTDMEAHLKANALERGQTDVIIFPKSLPLDDEEAILDRANEILRSEEENAA